MDETTRASIGLDLMEEEFVTFGTAKVMICNIDYNSAFEISQEIEDRLKIYEIANSVGFNDAKYFSKLFKEVTGLTPSEFKNQDVY